MRKKEPAGYKLGRGMASQGSPMKDRRMMSLIVSGGA